MGEAWRPAPLERQRSIRCAFERDNPLPPCGWCAEEGCSDCDGYVPIESCPLHPAVRVHLGDGTWVDACSPEAHVDASLVRWALYHVVWQPSHTALMKYYYRDHEVAELAQQVHPMLRALAARREGI